MEKMDSDLQQIINSKQELSDDHYQFILYQILRALYYLHSANIIHRDFKPSNVLINEDCTIKLCDFGMSRNISGDNLELTEYVVTRYYRAPEVMLSSHHYSKKVDVWSVGCTFAEILAKDFLFKGDNYLEQIKKIIETLGSPSEEDMMFITNEAAKNYVKQFQNIQKKKLKDVVNYDNVKAIDLLEKMIVFNPNKRISIDEAMNHPYLQAIKEGIVDNEFQGEIDLGFDHGQNWSFDMMFNRLILEINSFDSGAINLSDFKVNK